MSSSQTCFTVQELESVLQSDVSEWVESAAPYTQPDWVFNAVRFLGDEQVLNLVVVKDSGQVALAPLCWRGGWLGSYDQLGVTELGEPGELLFSQTRLLDRLANYLASHRVPLSLSRVPAESPVITAIQRAYRRIALVSVRQRNGCPYIKLERESADADHLLSSSLRSDLRRAQKRAKSLGAVEFKIFSPKSDEELEPLWQQALDIEAASWKGETGSALKYDARVEAFYKAYVRSASRRKELRLCYLFINDQPVAMQIAIVTDNRFWLLKIGYNAEYANCSPGLLLMRETLDYAWREGLKSYEFMGFAKSWTRRWTSRERSNVAVIVYPYTFRGLMRLGLDFGSSVLQKSRIQLQRLNNAVVR